MPTLRRSRDLGSRDARKRLAARPEPYFQTIHRGLALGYRKSRDGGAWIVRRYDGATGRNTERRVGTADDHADADGLGVLSHAQAQRKALEEIQQQARLASGQHYTVADAVAEYLDHQRTHAKSAADAETKLKAYVLHKLGARKLADLKPADFDAWLDWAMKRPFTRKVRKASPAYKRKSSKAALATARPEAAELKRRRKSTINRVIATLKACLNYAHSRRRVAGRDAWSQLKKFRAVNSARVRWLSIDEVQRLMNASAPDARLLVQAGVLTGCREGELVAARARDFDAASSTLLIPDSKSGHPRRVELSDEGIALFVSLASARKASDLLFTRKDGTPWHRVAVIRAMHAACAAAKIDPPATFYALRHTYASHLVQAGTQLIYVAAQLGHSDVRMVQKHYGHFAPSHVADAIRANLPTFGIVASGKVKSIAAARAGRKK